MEITLHSTDMKLTSRHPLTDMRSSANQRLRYKHASLDKPSVNKAHGLLLLLETTDNG